MVEPATSTRSNVSHGQQQQQQTQQQRILAWLQRWLSITALLLRVLLWPLRWLVGRWIFPPGEWDGLTPAVTAKAARQFVNHLQRLGVVVTRSTTTTTNSSAATSSTTTTSLINDTELWISSSGFSTVQQEALEQQSLVLVFLHSPLHGQADVVCRDFLGHPSVVEFLRQPNVMAFGCSIHTGQGAQLAHWLSASAFPLVALLQPKNTTTTATTNTNNNNANNNNMSLVYKAEGPALLQMIASSSRQLQNRNLNPNSVTNSNNLIAQWVVPHWMSALQRFQIQAAEQEARRIQRQQEQELRRQQDEEYQETLRQDQARQAQLQQQQEEERRRLQEQEDAVQRQVQAKQRRLEVAQSLIQDEPTVGGTRIRFVLPTGTKLDRKFHSDQTLASLKAFVFMHFYHKSNGAEQRIVNIGLSTNFPKKTFTEQDDDKTLQEVGLAPQAVLMVQDLDA